MMLIIAISIIAASDPVNCDHMPLTSPGAEALNKAHLYDEVVLHISVDTFCTVAHVHRLLTALSVKPVGYTQCNV